MTTTSEKIIKTIKESHLEPAPKWRFLAKNWVFWTLFAIALVIGALSFATMLDVIVGHDWDIYPYLHKSFWTFLFISLPYLWIIFLSLFAWAAYFNFIHTKGWYHHRVYLVVLASAGLSVAAGCVLFYYGVGGKIEESVSANLPYLNAISSVDKKTVWDHPDDGLLGGQVVLIESSSQFMIQDLENKQWQVIDESAADKHVEVEIGEKVKIIGQEKAGNTFVAKEIREWDPHEAKRAFPKPKQTLRQSGSSVCATQEKSCD
ncbi:MAG TPA: hypothetical protein VF817_02665 [Patescibacteria group bacterium]